MLVASVGRSLPASLAFIVCVTPVRFVIRTEHRWFSAHAIGDAYRFIKYGDADVMVCGGSEGSVHEPALAGFARMNALSTR